MAQPAGITATSANREASAQLTSLPKTEQASLRTAFGAARRAVTPLTEHEASLPQNEGVRFFAAHPGQQLTARFLDGAVRVESGRGGDWQGTLRLTGAAGETSTRPLPVAQENRVEYRHGGGVTEWYENKPEGLEHGFTITQRPDSAATTGKLRVDLQLDGLSARAVADDNGSHRTDMVEFLNPATGSAVVSYGQLKVWDATGRELPARLEAFGSSVAILVADAGATYPVTIDPLITSQESKLLPEFGDGAPDDHFGSAVALEGDTAVIGVPTDDTVAGANAGSVYVFVRNGDAWSFQQKILAADGMADDNFGYQHVAISGNTIVVGAWGNDHPTAGTNAGAAYVFTRSGTTWTQQQKLRAGTPEANAEFGVSVGISGDTAVVGAVRAATYRGADTGVAYAFVRSDGVWTQQAIFTGSDVNTGDLFALWVAISGDTIIAGAQGHDLTGVASQGAAYVFVRDGTTWTQQQKLTALDATPNDDFGRAVALDGNTAVIGAYFDDIGAASDAGSAYVFVRSGTTWTQQAKLTANAPEAGARFGLSVAVAGDTALVGSYLDDTTAGTDAGSVSVFVRTGTVWSQQAELTASDAAANDWFGNSVAVSGDTALVGAVLSDTAAGTDAGSAYVFRLRLVEAEIALTLGAGTELINGVSSVDFGTVNLGESFSPPTLTLHSLSEIPLTVSAIQMAGGDAGDFKVEGITLPVTLFSGGSAAFTIVFSPTGIGPRATTLRILSNDPDENPFEVQLAGKGADFIDAPIYEIGEIPFQTVWHGQEVKFRVRATALGAGTPVQAGFVNPPSGVISFEAGNFFYRPGTNDKAEFTVTFSATSGANRLEQIVPIQPIPLLPPEGDLLGVERKGVPDPASRDYLVISDVKDTVATPFNHATRPLRVVMISGKEVVLRKDHANRLFESYNGNPDIRELHIDAEKLIVASPIRLPSTKVVIRARHLEFQDSGGQISHINTQPIDYSITPSQRTTPGGPGLTGGDIVAYVESVVVPTGPGSEAARFITRGGRGQNGAPGVDGTPGPRFKQTDPAHFTVVANRLDLPPIDRRNSTTGMAVGSARNARWTVYTSMPEGDNRLEIRQAGNNNRTTVINRWVAGSEWKPDGGGANAGGDPGNGGRAGRGRSNVPEILGIMDVAGGTPGTTPGYRGGAPGSPSPAYFYIATDRVVPVIGGFSEERVFELAATHIAVAGQDAPSKTGAAGANGLKEMTIDSLAWLSSTALRQVVDHARAAYLDGELEFTFGVATNYLARLDALRAAPEWTTRTANEQRDFGLLEEEMRLLAHRLASGLDYFGNPPGWVPLLSLEANKLAFEQEIDRAMGILYLEYWLSDVGRSLQSKIAAVSDARVKLAADSERLATEFDVANNLLPVLDSRIEAITTETTVIQRELKFLEEKLIREARDNLKVPFWRRLARGLATVAKMVPVPWVQAVGAGLDIVANFNSKAPWESLEGIKDVVDTYQSGGFKEDARNLNTAYKKIKFPDLPSSTDPNKIKGFVDDLQTASKPVVSRLKEVQQAFQAQQVPKTQIEAELAKLKAESKDFKQLGDRISSLLAEKEVFVQQLAQTMQSLGRLSENITGNLLAMDALNEGFTQASGALDDRALMYLKEMGRRARERLLLYHYFVKKAYEYRLLRPYPGRLDLQNLFERFLTLAQAGGGEYRQLTGEQFRELRGIYDDALGELIKEVVLEYNNNAPALSGPRRLSLTAEELARLNAGEEVVLDLRNLGRAAGLFPPTEENLRIASIRVLRMGVDPLANPQVADEVSLFIEHGGASTVQTTANNRPRSYQFVHYTGATEVPVQWGARVFAEDGSLHPISRSLSADSLLGSLLQKSGENPQTSGYFTYLGALAELRFKREQNVASGATLRLNEVVLQIEYEFVRRGSFLRSLEVSTADELAPYLEISTADLSGRQDGLGSFDRTYLSGTQVTLSAPDRIGNLRFAGFVDLAAPSALQGSGPVLQAERDSSAGEPVGATFDGLNHRLTLNMSSDRRIEARYVPVELLALAIQRTGPNHELRLELDGERYTPFKLEQSEEVSGPWSLMSEGILTDPIQVPIARTNELPRMFYRASPK